MNTTKLIALVLLFVGALALAYGGFSYTRETHDADLGPIKISITDREYVSVPLWAGFGLMIVGGAGLVLGKKR
jgi:TRAP-type C4-dicarboxylate transport system permease small subunit